MIVASVINVLRHNVCQHGIHNLLVARASSSLCSFHNSQDPLLRTGHLLVTNTGRQYILTTVACVHTQGPRKIEKKVQENLEKMRKGVYDTIDDPEDLTHFKKSLKKTESGDVIKKEPPIGTHALPHPIWSEEELHNVVVTHKKPQGVIDRMAYFSVQALRTGFDIFSGYSWMQRTESIWLTRIIFLETVAGVPGMVAAMTRHFHSLRRMRRDHGWIHTLLEEAENERMHLMTALQIKRPGILFRGAVIVSQGIFVNFFSLAYLISPRFCHRFVGYLEEEAVVTYSKCLQDMESGCLQHWNTQAAPALAKSYWKLAPDATMRDVILAIRADEAHHRVVNHTLGSMKPDDYNPYKPGQ